MSSGARITDNLKESLLRTLETLPEVSDKSAAVGFDGAIDSVVRPVKKVRESGVEFFKTIDEFGGFISASAGLSCAVDVRLVSERVGGNMPLLSRCLKRLGARVSCVGTLGVPEPMAAFADIGSELVSCGEAGRCTALQFDDGKVMLSDMRGASELDYAALSECVGAERLRRVFSDCGLAAFVNWAELDGATDIWRGVLENIWKPLGARMEALLLVDLTDCSRTERGRIVEVAELVGECARYRRTYWSLNEREAGQLAAALGLHTGGTEETAALLFDALECAGVFVHGIDGCAVACAAGCTEVAGFPIEKPLISVGGGDNFNAGLAFSLLNSFSETEAALFAGAVSACYVRDGESPDVSKAAALIMSRGR